MEKFVARKDKPKSDNKFYIHTSFGGVNSCILRNKKTGSVLPNCVGYSWGRAYELLGKKPKLSRGNAENWYGYNDGYERGQEPRLGAIMCWKGKGNLAGHVCNVEKHFSDGSVITSNSNYSGTEFYLKEFKKPYKISSNYEFQGFIYLPKEFEEEETKEDFFGGLGYFKDGDKHKNIGKIAKFMRKTFPAYTSEKALGDYYGPYIKASIKEFQRRAKAERNYNSTIDGYTGPITLESLKKYGFKE